MGYTPLHGFYCFANCEAIHWIDKPLSDPWFLDVNGRFSSKCWPFFFWLSEKTPGIKPSSGCLKVVNFHTSGGVSSRVFPQADISAMGSVCMLSDGGCAISLCWMCFSTDVLSVQIVELSTFNLKFCSHLSVNLHYKISSSEIQARHC